MTAFSLKVFEREGAVLIGVAALGASLQAMVVAQAQGGRV